MRLTNGERLILAMMADIHKALSIRGDIDADLVSSALWHRNEWALDWQYGFLLDQEENPPHVNFVVDVMDMWSFIESSHARLSDTDKARFEEVYPYEPRFEGFDGNNESDHMSAATFLVEKLNKFSSFSGRADLNSHSPTLARYRRMLEVFLPLRKTVNSHDKRHLSADDLIAIFADRRSK